MQNLQCHDIINIAITYAAVAEWQTRYFEGVVIFRSCEFKSHQPHHKTVGEIQQFFYVHSLDRASLRAYGNNSQKRRPHHVHCCHF